MLLINETTVYSREKMLDTVHLFSLPRDSFPTGESVYAAWYEHNQLGD